MRKPVKKQIVVAVSNEKLREWADNVLINHSNVEDLIYCFIGNVPRGERIAIIEVDGNGNERRLKTITHGTRTVGKRYGRMYY